MGIVWKNTTPCTELPRDFCAGIGPLQLGVVLVSYYFLHYSAHFPQGQFFTDFPGLYIFFV